jgi:hypothetical protein
MLYFQRKDRNGIAPDETLFLSRYLNDCPAHVRIPDWKKEVPDASEVLGKVFITPYNGNTMGVVEDDLNLRSKVIIEILKDADYAITSLPHERWTRKEIVRFMGLGEGRLNGCRIYIPPNGGNPVRMSKTSRRGGRAYRR